ncbi:MAG: hypothetical protein NZ958_06560 [Bacteroidia bacterium]|nr:hypothetical protein [Bacteroidia bacterium]MDW8089720.1 hypothetical protein [Bacteroidia bacterium]
MLRLLGGYLWHSPRPVVRWLIWLSWLSTGLAAWAWVAVASVFNGFSAFLEEVFQRVDPHIRIVGAGLSDSLCDWLGQQPGVLAVSRIYERIAVLKYGQRQAVARLRLVDTLYAEVTHLGAQLVAGMSFPLAPGGVLIGAGVANRLVLLDPAESSLRMYVVLSGQRLAQGNLEALPRKAVVAQGIFSVQKEYDESWVIARQADWPQVHGPYDVVEVRLRPGVTPQKFQSFLRRYLPPTLEVQDPPRQHEGLYRVLAQEKALARLGLILLLLLTASSTLSTLATLFLVNRKDWAVYQALGLPPYKVQRLVGLLGVGLVGAGSGLGLLLGTLTVWLQDRYKFLKLRGGEGFLINYFPVRLAVEDFIWFGVILAALMLGLYGYGQYQLRAFSLRAALQGD